MSAPTAAHNAAAIAATPHNNVAGTNVQAQLQEIVTDLVATGAASPGAGARRRRCDRGRAHGDRCGHAARSLVTLLGGLNSHVNQASGAHAERCLVADSGNNLNAANVEAALAGSSTPSRATTSRQRGERRPAPPSAAPLGGTKALILDSNASGAASTHLRIYADGSIWFTLNASWDGTQWVRDAGGTFCGAFRFARNEIEFLHEDSFAATFTTWTHVAPADEQHRQLRVRADGTVREVGRLGMEWTNAERDAHARWWRRHVPQPVPGDAVVDHVQRAEQAAAVLRPFERTSPTAMGSASSDLPVAGGQLSDRVVVRLVHRDRVRAPWPFRRSPSTELVQRCARCDRENRVALADRGRGEHDEQVEDGVVPLPECPTCPLAEFLVRSPVERAGAPWSGQLGHLHRLMVDELHSELVKKGRVVER